MNVPTEVLLKKDQILNKFYHLFFAEERGKRIKDEKNLKFILLDGISIILLGKSIGYMPGEFVKKTSEAKDGNMQIIAEENSQREYVPGEFFYGINQLGQGDRIMLSDVNSLEIVSK